MKRPQITGIIMALVSVCMATAVYAGYQPKDYSITAETKGFPGAKANMTARIAAAPELVWQATLNSNTHAGKYPKIKQSFCVTDEQAQDAKAKKLRNGATVLRLYGKAKCNAPDLREVGKAWDYNLYQLLDYPFPLADRWMITKTHNDETRKGQQIYEQTGKLIYGRQDIYEFTIKISPHPNNKKHSKFDFYVWTDPGGFIADWMIQEATKYIAPEFMRVLEIEAQKLVGGGKTSSPEPEK